MKASRISQTLAKKTLERAARKVSKVLKVYVVVNGVVEYCS
jgi:hypothetical protein